MMMSNRFQHIINSNKMVLVDFYADWCIPCKQVPPILKQVKVELNESLRIIKVNVDKNPLIATKYQIRNLPTVIIFKNGELIWKGMGVIDIEDIKTVIQNHKIIK